MSKIRKIIEAWFEAFARLIYRNRIKTLLVMILFTVLTTSQVPRIVMDMSAEGMLHEDDPAYIAYQSFREQFGRDEAIIIALKPENVFDKKFLLSLKNLHEKIEENVPYIDEITSLINARDTRGDGDELIVEDLFENWPETEEEILAIKERALSNHMYKNLLISENGTFTTILILIDSYSSNKHEGDILDEFDDNITISEDDKNSVKEEREFLSHAEKIKAINKISEIVNNYRSNRFPVYLAGSPVLENYLKETIVDDMVQFTILAIITIAMFLFIMFRRISGVILPLFIVILSLMATFGLMAMFNVPVTVTTQILPSFLLAVGVGASVHILAIFYYRFRHTNDKEDAIVYSLGHSGLPVVMTSITTAGGLLSFATSSLESIGELGIFSSIGIFIALANTLVLLPSLLALIPIKNTKSEKTRKKTTFIDGFLASISKFSTSHPVAILLASAIIVGISGLYASKIRFSHNPLSWFPEDNYVRVSTQKIDQELRGSITLEVIVDTGKENGLFDPDILKRLEKAEKYAESLQVDDIFGGKAWSLTAILKEINQALNENRPEYYTIPDDPELIAQEFLLFENSGSDDLEDVVDTQFSKARLSIKVPWEDAIKYEIFLNNIDSYFKKQFPKADICVTGMMSILLRTVSNSIISMAHSYIIAIFVISILMILLIGRVRIGLFSMIPNLAPIVIMLGIVGGTNMPMDLSLMIVGCIAMGLAVDDTIHFMHNFRRYYEQTGDPVIAVHKTLDTTGRAMLVTTTVLSLGFFIYGFATLSSLVNFGILTGVTIIMALLADYFLAPALMVLINRKKTVKLREHEKQVSQEVSNVIQIRKSKIETQHNKHQGGL